MKNVLALGRVVHVRIGGTEDYPTLRPATVVRVWSDSLCNLQMQTDGSNDRDDLHSHGFFASKGCGVGGAPLEIPASIWLTSRSDGPDIGQWRWPEIKKTAVEPFSEPKAPATSALSGLPPDGVQPGDTVNVEVVGTPPSSVPEIPSADSPTS